MSITEEQVAPAMDGSGAPQSLPAILVARADTTPDRVAIRSKELGRWRQISFAEYAAAAAAVGLGLRGLGVGPGDTVAVHAENRPEWLFADIGAQGIGAVVVGVYPTSPATEVEYLLAHSESVVLFAEDEEQLDKVLEVRSRLSNLRHIVVFDTRGVRDLVADDPMLMTFDELVSIGRQAAGATDDDGAVIEGWRPLVAEVGPEDVSIIVYTSGTTGPPKGAMLCQRNLLTSIEAYQESFATSPDDEVLSYLPLCHIAERLVSVINALGGGYVVNFGEGGDSFLTDLQETQPTFLLGVPRVWEKMLAGIQLRMQDSSRLKRALYAFWLRRGGAIAVGRWRGEFGIFARIQYFIGWLLVYRTLRAKMGLGRIRVALSGAAPIAPKVLEYFWALGVPVREGYGQTENTAQATLTPEGDVRIGTVGTAAPGVEIRIADDGEILTRSDGVFVGYLKNPEATAETIDAEGWLHTGDVGVLDEDGFLTITDRKKDIIITAGGKNISPSEIENRLKVSPYIQEAIVIGDRRKYLSALIGIDYDTVGDWAARRGVTYTTYEDLAAKAEVVNLIDGEVTEANVDFAQVETVKQFRLLPKELDHEHGEVTATQKVKRAAIATQYGPLIEEMYG